MPNTFGLDHSGLIYNEPGRLAMVASGRDPARAAVGLMFTGTLPDYDWHDTQGCKRLVAEHFASAGWQVPALLAALHDAPELYFDTISQVRMDRWSAGRIVLLGDAAWCPGPGGNGTGHAMLGAYTLAGELALAGGDHVAAYRRYEQIMRPPVAKSQKQAAGCRPLPHSGDRAEDPQPQPHVPDPVRRRRCAACSAGWPSAPRTPARSATTRSLAPHWPGPASCRRAGEPRGGAPLPVPAPTVERAACQR